MDYKLVGGVYRIPNFTQVKTDCASFIEATAGDIDLAGRDEITQKSAYRARTQIRKKKEEVSTLRKEASKACLAVFQGQCKTLEDMLATKDDELTKYLDSFKEPKPPVTIITCEVIDEKTLQKALQFLKELGLEPKTKAK